MDDSDLDYDSEDWNNLRMSVLDPFLPEPSVTPDLFDDDFYRQQLQQQRQRDAIAKKLFRATKSGDVFQLLKVNFKALPIEVIEAAAIDARKRRHEECVGAILKRVPRSVTSVRPLSERNERSKRARS